MKTRSCVIILAGGNSIRMAYPKPFLIYRGKTFLQNIVDEYRSAGIKQIYIVLNNRYCQSEWENCINPIRPFTKIIKNSHPELGRGHSLKLGLQKIVEIDFCFIQNSDQPFVTKNIIERLWENRLSSGYTAPYYNGKGGHPVLISAPVIEAVHSVSSHNLNLRELLEDFPVKRVGIDNEKILWNINTKEDYQQYVHPFSEELT